MSDTHHEFDLDVSEAEFVAARYLNMRPRTWLGVLGVGSAVLYALLIGFATFQSVRTGEAWLVTVSFWAVALFLIWFFFVEVRRVGRRLYRQRKGPHVARCRLTEKELEFSGELGQGQIPYDHFTKWRENRQLLLLYSADDLFHILPKRCLGPESVGYLSERLEHHAGKAT